MARTGMKGKPRPSDICMAKCDGGNNKPRPNTSLYTLKCTVNLYIICGSHTVLVRQRVFRDQVMDLNEFS